MATVNKTKNRYFIVFFHGIHNITKQPVMGNTCLETDGHYVNQFEFRKFAINKLHLLFPTITGINEITAQDYIEFLHQPKKEEKSNIKIIKK